MKEKLKTLEEIIRKTCSLDGLDREIVFAYTHITMCRLSHAAHWWDESSYIPDENFIQLWEHFRSESSYEFVRDLLVYAYEDNGNFKVDYSFDSYGLRALTEPWPRTDEIKHILIRGFTDPNKSEYMRMQFIEIFCNSFSDKVRKEFKWHQYLSIMDGDPLYGANRYDLGEFLDTFHLYLDTDIPNELSVSISSSKNDEFSSRWQEVSKSNSTLQILRMLNEFALRTRLDCDIYQNLFLVNCLGRLQSLCHGITKGSFPMREGNTILPALYLWELYNPESYEQFLIELFNASDDYRPHPLNHHASPVSIVEELFDDSVYHVRAIPPSEEISKMLTRRFWDREQDEKHRIDCFLTLHWHDYKNYLLNFLTNDIERFIRENECNFPLISKFISTILIFSDDENPILDKKLYDVCLGYADAHPETRVELMGGWLEEEFEEIPEKIRAQKDDDTLDKITIPDMTFVPIPSGEFLMGYTESTSSITEKAFPGIQVAVEGFEMLSTPVTMGMWKSLFNYCPVAGLSDDSAIYKLCLYDCIKFATALSAIDDEYDYRLPTEAEYEYAAKAGITSEYCFGYKAIEETRKESNNETQPNRIVGNSAPNPWGLYDMCGLVRQWCSGTFNPVYPLSKRYDDYKCGYHPIVKGYSSASYSGYEMSSKDNHGFRLVRELKQVSL